jgi:hypothetical protein
MTAAGVEVTGAQIGADEAETVWRRLRRLHDDSGLWPFLCDDSPEGTAKWADEFADHERLTSVPVLDADAVVSALVDAQRRKCSGIDPKCDEYWAGLFSPDRVRADMATAPPEGAWDPYSPIGGLMRQPGWICLVRADGGYQLPELLGRPHANDWWGGPNHDRLTGADHVGVLRSWHDRFGADVMMLGAVALTLDVRHPPVGVDHHVSVAIEQFAYCDDLDQFIGEPHRVARRQAPASRWYFWWD